MRNNRKQDRFVDPAVVGKTSIRRWSNLRRSPLPCLIARKFLFYLRFQRGEASGLKRAEVELEEEQRREQRDEFEQEY